MTTQLPDSWVLSTGPFPAVRLGVADLSEEHNAIIEPSLDRLTPS